MPNAAILLGAGQGSRMINGENKILTLILDKPVFAYSLEAFIESGTVNTLVIVHKDSNQKTFMQHWISHNLTHSLNILWTQGGQERHDSVLAGLKVLPKDTQYVFIHDLARPLIQANSIQTIAHFLKPNSGTALAHRVVDTIKQTLLEFPSQLNNLDRKTLWSMETPQAFEHSIALQAYELVEQRRLKVTDDVEAVSLLDYPVTVVENTAPNPKITLPSDLNYIKFLLTHQQSCQTLELASATTSTA